MSVSRFQFQASVLRLLVKIFGSAVIIVAHGTALTGCGAVAPVKAEIPPPQQPQATVPPPEPAPPQPTMSRYEKLMLDKAHQAFREGRYTLPAHDNAYDQFQSVLLINGDNDQARAGIQAILLRYAEQIRNAMAAKRYKLALSVVDEAQPYFPDNKLLAELQSQAREKLTAVIETPRVPPLKVAAKDEYMIHKGELDKRSDGLTAQLAFIAQRLQETDESIIIYAPTDRAGRWIYKQLKAAVPGYRVRGDIRISSIPKLAILPPL